MTAGTVWVQIGQCTIPRTPFSAPGFILLYPLTTSDAKTQAEVVGFYKLFQISAGDARPQGRRASRNNCVTMCI